MSEQSLPKKKITKRGKIVLGSFATVLVLVLGAAVLFSVSTTPKKQCEFVSSSSSSSNSNQIAVVLAPTTNFVDISTLVSRAGLKIKNDLGFSLDDKKEALNRELALVTGDSSPKLIVNSFIDPANGTESQEIETQISSTYDFLDLSVECMIGAKAKPDDRVPLSKESDMLKALSAASDQFSHTGNKTIYVLGNGIQTAGAIQMQDSDTFPKSEARALSMAKSLAQSGNLPDLTGVTVKWFGLGQVDGANQKTLPTSWAKGLKSFWKSVVTLSGGTMSDEDICEQCGSGVPNSLAIPVHPIQIADCPLIVKLYESDGVEFNADKDTFVSQENAVKAAENTVTKFKTKGCATMTVTGYAAAGVSKSEYLTKKKQIDATNLKLTENRAKAFAKLLTDAGFNGDITFVGGGTCGTEWGGDGKPVEIQQRLCRRVEVSN